MKPWSRARATLCTILAFGVFAAPSLLLAATPSSGTLSSIAGSTTKWTGSAVAATNGESTCVDGTNCDVYTLNLSGSTTNYSGKYVTIKATWAVSADEYDLYVHKGGLTGPVIASATQGPLIGSQTVQFSPGSTGARAYTIHIVASVVSPGDPYKATASVGTTPPPPPSAKFKAPTYRNLHSPTGIGDNSGEPSIGANWNTGNIMTNAVLDTLRVSFNTATSPATPTWTLVDSPITSTTSLDPILFTDSVTGRTFVSQLAGTTSLAAFTDDDGVTYRVSQGGGIASGVDHQTVGGGPFKECTPLQAQLNPGPVQCCSRAVRSQAIRTQSTMRRRISPMLRWR